MLRFAVTLEETEPPIWRRIEIPATYDFWGLHVAIQDAMGWLDMSGQRSRGFSGLG